MKREYIYGLLLGAALLACLGAAVEAPFNANSSANVKGNLSVTGTNFANYLVSSNEISTPALAVGTLYLSNMVASTLGGFDASLAFVPLSMTTNVLDLLYTESNNLTNWGKLATNVFQAAGSYQPAAANLTNWSALTTNSMAPLASPPFTGTPTLDGNPLLTNVTKALVTNAMAFSGNSGKLITAAATEIDVPAGGAGIAGTLITNGAAVAEGDLVAYGSAYTNTAKATSANVLSAIGTGATPQFARLGLGGAASGTSAISLPSGTSSNPSLVFSATDDGTGSGLFWDGSGVAFAVNGTKTAMSLSGGFYVGALLMDASNGDVSLRRDSANVLQIGSDASPATAQSIKAGDGNSTDSGGGGLNVEGGQSTGTAAGGFLDLRTSISGEASGSGLNAYTTRFHAKAKHVALTHDTETTIISFSLAANKALGGTIVSTCYATNSTPHVQSKTSVITFDAIAIGTAITCTNTVVDNATAADSGALATVYTVVDLGGNVFAVQLKATSDLTTPTERCKLVVTALNGNAATTITDP